MRTVVLAFTVVLGSVNSVSGQANFEIAGDFKPLLGTVGSSNVEIVAFHNGNEVASADVGTNQRFILRVSRDFFDVPICLEVRHDTYVAAKSTCIADPRRDAAEDADGRPDLLEVDVVGTDRASRRTHDLDEIERLIGQQAWVEAEAKLFDVNRSFSDIQKTDRALKLWAELIWRARRDNFRLRADTLDVPRRLLSPQHDDLASTFASLPRSDQGKRLLQFAQALAQGVDHSAIVRSDSENRALFSIVVELFGALAALLPEAYSKRAIIEVSRFCLDLREADKHPCLREFPQDLWIETSKNGGSYSEAVRDGLHVYLINLANFVFPHIDELLARELRDGDDMLARVRRLVEHLYGKPPDTSKVTPPKAIIVDVYWKISLV